MSVPRQNRFGADRFKIVDVSRSEPSRGSLIGAAPALVLLGYAVAFGAAALGASLPAFDDHPGQLYRLWHVVIHGPAPWAWNAGWWTGYPEMQFYPPGFADLGALLHVASFGALSVEAAYQTLLWVTWLAPGVTTYLVLAVLLGDGWLALPGAFVALTLSSSIASGVEGGVHIGMAPARLGWALLPLLLLALLRWLDDDERTPWAAALLVAAIVLTHPAHLPAALTLVAIAALAGAGDRTRRVRQAFVVLAGAAALTGFWTLPLVARIAHTRALAWGRLSASDVWSTLTTQPLLAALVILSLAAFLARDRAARVVALWPWAMVVAVALDGGVLEPLGLRSLPADRIADGAWLAFVVAAGFGVGTLLGRVAVRRPAPAAVAAVAAVAALAALSLLGSSLMLWPRGSWPSYETTARGLRLPDLWRALAAAPPGRALFVRSGVPLVHGTQWWRPHTHITSLTPLHGDRAIVNGTFTHPSPVAALVYRGDAGPGAITSLVERLDGESLFGRALDTLDAATLDRLADGLGVRVIVALEDDRPRLRALDDRARFAPLRGPAPFLLYVRTAPVALPRPVGPDRWRLEARPGADGWAPARVAYYPLWRAQVGGAALATRRGEDGQLLVKVTGATVVELRYGPGVPEIAGIALSVAALLVLAAAWGRDVLRARRVTAA